MDIAIISTLRNIINNPQGQGCRGDVAYGKVLASHMALDSVSNTKKNKDKRKKRTITNGEVGRKAAPFQSRLMSIAAKNRERDVCPVLGKKGF